MDINKYEVILTDTAKEEIEEIYEYISKNLYEEIAANKLMEKIERGFFTLESSPYSFTKVCVKPHNEIYRRLIVDNFIVLYDIKEEYKQVIIYRVLNGRMDYLNIMEEI